MWQISKQIFCTREKHSCNTLRRPLHALCTARGPMTTTIRCNESLKLPYVCTFCLCIHASLSPEMNSLGPCTTDLEKPRKRVPRSVADCETRVPMGRTKESRNLSVMVSRSLSRTGVKECMRVPPGF